VYQNVANSVPYDAVLLTQKPRLTTFHQYRCVNCALYWCWRAGVKRAKPFSSIVLWWMKKGWSQTTGLGQGFVFLLVLGWRLVHLDCKNLHNLSTMFSYKRNGVRDRGKMANAGLWWK